MPNENKSQSEHILELSREILDDIELSRLNSEKLLLKCSRLARLVGSSEIQSWIGYEMSGYNSTDPVSLKYVTRTLRWTDYEKREAYWGSFAVQEAFIATQTAKIASLKLPNIGGDYANMGINNIIQQINAANLGVTIASKIRSRVIGLLHEFVTGVYYEREFAGMAESTFERYKRDVDALIAEKAGDVLSKIPAVVDRLAEGDNEGVSQALSTCRRIVESFADAIYPPTDETVEIGGNVLKLDSSKHQNRINVYISQRTESASRRQRLRQNLANLFDRVSTGVHNDVTAEEAFSLFLNVYLFLGEVLHLGVPSAGETPVA